MKRAYKFRAYPTRPQEGRAAPLLADHCDLYNAALEERREAWRRHSVNVSYGTQSAQSRAIRAADPDGQGLHSFTAQQQTLRRLDVVFRRFCARAQAGGAGYPRFKAYSRFHQVLFVAGDGARWEPAAGRWAYARFRAVGSVKVLNKMILDAGWAQFMTILTGKAEEAGRLIALVNPARTSTDCHQCGARCHRPRQNLVICPEHGGMDADINAARNIAARAGLGSGHASTA
jgi:transposase